MSNFADLVLRHAASQPDRVALILPTRWDADGVHEREQVTYGELARRIADFQAGLAAQGLGAGDRLVLMFPVGLDLYALTLAAMASGLAVVLVDAGMPPRKILQAIRSARAQAIVSVRALLRYRFVAPALWGLRWFCTDGGGLLLRSFDTLRAEGTKAGAVPRSPDDHALITFTSGSTGRPKGADRTHGLLSAQHHALAAHFPHQAGEVDLPAFPVVVLHDLCCGVTAAVPPIDFRAVAQADRDVVLGFAREVGVTRLAGSPAYIEALVVGPLDLPSLRQLGVGGARVSRQLCARIRAATDAEAKVLYGSTEAEPIASATLDEVLADDGVGVLVGAVAEAAEVLLVELPDAPFEGPMAKHAVAEGEVGELVVRGPHVNRGYLDDPVATAANKVFDGDSVWHRTGDRARWDGRGRLWLVGRVPDVVQVGDRRLDPYPLEEAIEAREGITRCALIAGPVLAVAGEASAIRALSELPSLAGIRIEALDALPVDARHNSKIDRVALRARLS